MDLWVTVTVAVVVSAAVSTCSGLCFGVKWGADWCERELRIERKLYEMESRRTSVQKMEETLGSLQGVIGALASLGEDMSKGDDE